CRTGTTDAAASRTAGTALSAAVVDGSPAASEVWNWIVLPSVETNCCVARYSWYAPFHWAAVTLPAGAAGTGGTVAGSGPEPSTVCSALYWTGVNPVPPTGLSGPVTPVNSLDAPSFTVAAWMADASSQAGTGSL